MKQQIWVGLLIAGGALSAFGQPGDSRRATIRGSRGEHGKCTIEVNVDGVAEIEISGDRATMKTLAGQRANFVRFECNDVLPRDAEDFRFSGVDGRGRQTLVRDPRANRGVAVVRIEDTQGGREGYTFDIEWRGYAGGVNNGGPGPGPINPDRGRYDPGRYDNSSNQGTQRAIDVCTTAVKDKVAREYGYRNIEMGRVGIDDNPGRRDWVVGRFIYRRGRSSDEFQFSCSVDLSNGRVRSVEVKRW